ncbi:MAG TPA: zf-HC2 domain-containing protein [Gemmatimonadaceae bacterium]
MTHPTITCGRFNEQLADFLERAVSEPTRAAMESHAVGCEDCGPLLGDLRRLRIDAANLPELVASRDLWSGIASRIEAPVLTLPGSGAGRAHRWANPLVLSLAAAGLVAITATVTHWMEGGRVDRSPGGQPTQPTQTAQHPTPTVSSPSVAAVPDSVVPASPASGLAVHPSTRPPVHPVSYRPSAEQTYDREIGRLLVVYDQRRPALDSTTIAVVKKNLKIIDDAIAQTKIALRRDPASQYLMESLNDAFDTKVQLLRKAAMLPSGT